MSFFSQTASLTATGIRGISQRPGASLVTVIGIMTVVAVLLSLLSLSEGVREMNKSYVRPDRIMIQSKGARGTASSSLSRATVLKILDAPGIKRTPDGTPYANAAVASGVDVVKKDGRRGTVYLVGITGGRELINPDMTIVKGRDFTPALREIIVSESANRLYRKMDIGDRLTLRGGEWTIVGIFKDTGGPNDSQILTDANTFMSAFKRNEYLQAAVILESPAAFETLKDALTSDPSLAVEVKTDAQMMDENFGQLYRLLDFVAYFIGIVMASGAIFGALNALYASVDSRRREIATLRAIGFNNGPIILSVLAEALVLAVPAALIGTLLAWLLFNGDVANIQGIVFKLAITPNLVLTAVLWALAIGFIGGSLPALRAASLPVATALRRT
jgi:putative ABC transport system permease protein